MSYFDGPDTGHGWAAGHFLVNDETCLRETMMVSANHTQAETRGTRTVVPAGAVIPANGATAVGILYEDIDVTNGDMPASVVTQGTIYGDRLPEALDADAATALTGITVLTEPTITRPDYFSKEWASLTVTSEEGASSGKTKLTVTGVTLGSGEKLQYKAGDTTPDIPTLGGEVSGWTDLTSGSEYTIADGKKVAVVAVTAGGFVFGGGSTTADTKA